MVVQVSVKFILRSMMKIILGAIALFFGYKFGMNSINLECKNVDNQYSEVVTQPLTLHESPNNQSKLLNNIFEKLQHPEKIAMVDIVLSEIDKWSETTCNSFYITRTEINEQDNKCVAIVPVEYQRSLSLISHRFGNSEGKWDQYLSDYSSRPGRMDAVNFLKPFYSELDNVKRMFIQKLGGASIIVNGITTRRSIVVMVVNEGVMNLLINFFCSIRSIDNNIDLKSFVVFVGEEKHVSIIENIGAIGVYFPSAGSMPKDAAMNYADDIFFRMMLLKTTSAYIALTCGFNVLFQDVDMIWFKNPLPFLQSLAEDIIFMDDGARSSRFAPFFANSGFYYMKYNQKNLYFQERFMRSVHEISYTHSHQCK